MQSMPRLYNQSVVEEETGHESQGAWRQDELIGGKTPIIK
jgi:hypothetical protein